MKRIIFLLLFFITGSCFSQIRWHREFGYSNAMAGKDLAIRTNGTYLLSVEKFGIGSNPDSFFVYGLNLQGNVYFRKQIDSIVQIFGVIGTYDNGFCVAGYWDDMNGPEMRLFKYDSLLNLSWSKHVDLNSTYNYSSLNEIKLIEMPNHHIVASTFTNDSYPETHFYVVGSAGNYIGFVNTAYKSVYHYNNYWGRFGYNRMQLRAGSLILSGGVLGDIYEGSFNSGYTNFADDYQATGYLASDWATAYGPSGHIFVEDYSSNYHVKFFDNFNAVSITYPTWNDFYNYNLSYATASAAYNPVGSSYMTSFGGYWRKYSVTGDTLVSKRVTPTGATDTLPVSNFIKILPTNDGGYILLGISQTFSNDFGIVKVDSMLDFQYVDYPPQISNLAVNVINFDSVRVDFTLSDFNSDTSYVIPSFSIDACASWNNLNVLPISGNGTTNLATTQSGVNHSFYFKIHGNPLMSSICYPRHLMIRLIPYGNGIGTSDTVYHTPVYFSNNDIGCDWDPVTNPSFNTFFDIDFVDSLVGFISGYNGEILKTVDGGNSWNHSNTGVPWEWVKDIYFKDGQEGYGCCTNYKIIKTTNGGSTWNTISLPVNDSIAMLEAIEFNSAMDVALCSGGDISGFSQVLIRSSNGGTSWNTVVTGDNNSIFDFEYISNQTWVACGSVGYMIKSTDNGLTWSDLSGFSLFDLNSVDFYDDNIGIAVGGNNMVDGAIYKTTNGGNTWDTVMSNIGLKLLSVKFLDSLNIIATSTSGDVFKTNDGGEIWEIQSLSQTTTNNHLYAIDYNTNHSAFAVGDLHTIIRTDLTPSIGIENIEVNNTLKVFPNPSNGELTIHSMVGIPISHVVLYDINGSLKFELDVTDSKSELILDLGNDFAAGTYFLKVQCGLRTFYTKIILF